MAVNKESLEKKVEGRNLVIERIFQAPKEKVFLAYSDSEQLAEWWGPQGWNTENKRFEFQPEGVWHYCMRCQEQGDFYGQESWGKTVFQEIKAPEKIVYTDVFSDAQGNEAVDMPKVVVR
ncbi:SRPBCC family protein [Thalassobacillus devorans]|uniref:SRPBCC family protein n=1 Tax=Thalassobacillus devorans TaxID=279813 RepID=UPI0034E953E1